MLIWISSEAFLIITGGDDDIAEEANQEVTKTTQLQLPRDTISSPPQRICLSQIVIIDLVPSLYFYGSTNCEGLQYI